MYSFLLLIILIATSICKGQHEKKCDVFPKDQYIEVGSNASIECQSCGHGKIFWTLNNQRVDESLSNTISSSRTSLTLRNFTHPSATLQCHSVDTDLVLGGTTIKTYSKPSKISCTWHYENQIKGVGVPEMLTCSWEHQMNSPLKINYTVLCANAYMKKNCSSNVKTCTFPEMADKMVDNISVTVRAKTAAWEVSSDPQIFNRYHILKIATPKLKVTATSNHLSVAWNRSALVTKCEVKCIKAANERTPEWVLNKTLKPEDSSNVTITQVESCAYYNILVRCALDQAPWSDWSQEKILTKLKESDVKLHLWRKVAEPGKNGVRKVYLMWTEIPSTCQGTFTYTIKVNHTDTLCGNTTCDIDVNQDAYRLNLTVFHNEVLLAEESVYVPAIGETGLPQVTDMKASSLDGVVLVRWKAPLEPVSGYMIDWTHNGNQYYWKQSKYTNITLFDLLHKKPYNITVTPLFDDKTGQGTQALQICSRFGDPGKFIKIDIYAKDKSATVSWKLESEECSGVIVNYTVFYRATEGPLLNVTVDHTEPKIILTDLNPETEYSVYVEAIALTGTTKSSETSFNTKKFDPTLITALGVCGSIIILVVLSLGLCCATQWKKFKEKPVPNPSLSSLALWTPPSHQKGTSSFRPFSNPSESFCERIFMEDTEITSTPKLATGCNPRLNPASDQREEHAQPAITPAAEIQDERPNESVETQCDTPESTALLSSDKSLNPYRCQSSVETQPPRTSKQSKHLLPEKPQEKTATVYVTLDMFEHGQGR